MRESEKRKRIGMVCGDRQERKRKSFSQIFMKAFFGFKKLFGENLNFSLQILLFVCSQVKVNNLKHRMTSFIDVSSVDYESKSSFKPL